jgi:hypothetical protein
MCGVGGTIPPRLSLGKREWGIKLLAAAGDSRQTLCGSDRSCRPMVRRRGAHLAGEFGADSEKLQRRAIAKAAVRPFGIVFLAPRLDLLSRIRHVQKPVCIQALIAQPAVEALHISVLHRLSRLNMP